MICSFFEPILMKHLLWAEKDGGHWWCLVKAFYPPLKKGGREGDEWILITHLLCVRTSPWGCTCVISLMTRLPWVISPFYREVADDTHSHLHRGIWLLNDRPKFGVLHTVGPKAYAISTPPQHELLGVKAYVCHLAFFFSWYPCEVRKGHYLALLAYFSGTHSAMMNQPQSSGLQAASRVPRSPAHPADCFPGVFVAGGVSESPFGHSLLIAHNYPSSWSYNKQGKG